MLRLNWLNSLRSLLNTSDGRRKPAGRQRRERVVPNSLSVEVARATQALETRALLAFNVTIDASGNLVINDATGTDDLLTIQSDTDTNLFRISDSAQIFTTSISGATGSGTSSITVPFAAVTGSQVQIFGQNGDDSLTVDLSLGNFAKSVVFNGGLQTTRDLLTVTGGGTFTTVSHNFTNNTDGLIDITGNSQIEYASLDPTSVVTDNLSATSRIFTGSSSAETMTITDATGANLSIDSSLGVAVTFANPLSTLTINAGTGTINDTVTITSLDAAFVGSLTIDGGDGTDAVTLTPAISIGSLSIDNSETTNLNSGTVTTSGAQSYSGAVALGAATALNSNGGDITFSGTLNGARALTVTAGGGNLTFSGIVGGTTALSSILVNSANNVTFSNTVRTTGNLTQIAGTGRTTFNGTNGTGIGGALSLTTDAVTFSTAAVTTVGAVALSAQNDITLNASSGLNAGSSSIAISANQDGVGAEGLTQASGTTIQTTNTTASALNILVGGSGGAAIAALTTGTTAGTLIQITVGGAISDSNSTSTNITSHSSVLLTGAGAGTNLDDIETTLSALEADGGTGGIYITNDGHLVIGGISSATGLATAGGDIVLTGVLGN